MNEAEIEAEILKYKKLAIGRGIPELCADGLAKYIVIGHPVGDFLSAVIDDSLGRAFQHADPTNTKIMRQYAAFMYWDAPGLCHALSYGGNKRRIAWIEQHGLTNPGKVSPNVKHGVKSTDDFKRKVSDILK